MKKIIRIAICCLFCTVGLVNASTPPGNAGAKKDTKDTTETAASGAAYRIDKPGTITFTVGVKIKGKVEKPQVMIFLPKEKPYYNKATFSFSFMDDIMKPLPFTPGEK
jgi:hypothetical protein